MNIYCYPHHINDWSRKTAHLTMEEKGVYHEILDAMYLNNGRLPCDVRQLGRVIGVQTVGERKTLLRVIEQFLQKDGGFFTQKRVGEELVKIQNRSLKASENSRGKSNNINDMTSTDAERWLSDGKADDLLANKPITKNQKLATADEEFCKEEILPSRWQDVAEALEIPNEQIFKSWRKFKDMTSHPYQLSRWKAWIAKERGAKPQLEAAE